MKPIDGNTARFFGIVETDVEYEGIADNPAEGERIAGTLSNHPILLMANHGVTVTAGTVAEAFEHLFFFERAAKTLLLAYASGQPLNIMTDQIARKTAAGWKDYNGMALAHFDALKANLDREDMSYRD